MTNDTLKSTINSFNYDYVMVTNRSMADVIAARAEDGTFCPDKLNLVVITDSELRSAARLGPAYYGPVYAALFDGALKSGYSGILVVNDAKIGTADFDCGPFSLILSGDWDVSAANAFPVLSVMDKTGECCDYIVTLNVHIPLR